MDCVKDFIALHTCTTEHPDYYQDDPSEGDGDGLTESDFDELTAKEKK